MENLQTAPFRYSLDDIRRALQHALAEFPPEMNGGDLSPDANTLTKIYATMSFSRMDLLGQDQLSNMESEVLTKHLGGEQTTGG